MFRQEKGEREKVIRFPIAFPLPRLYACEQEAMIWMIC